MKKALAILVLSGIVFSAIGQKTVFTSTIRNTFYEGSLANPQLIVYTAHVFSGNSGWSFGNYALAGKKWAEVFCGPQYFSASGNFYASLYAGIETTNKYRMGTELTLKQGKFSLYSWYERGWENGASPWCWLTEETFGAIKNFKPKVKCYLTAKDIKVGPGFCWTISKTLSVTPIGLYNSSLREWTLQLNLSTAF